MPDQKAVTPDLPSIHHAAAAIAQGLMANTNHGGFTRDQAMAEAARLAQTLWAEVERQVLKNMR